jgi:Transferase family
MYPNYTRKLFIFQFAQADRREEASNAIRNALDQILRSHTPLAGLVGPKSAGKNSTIRSIHCRPVDINANGVFRVNINDHFPYSFRELEKRGMPPSLFKSAELHSFPDTPEMDDHVPIVGLQVNFLRDTLVLAIWTHHSVMDGVGGQTFTDLLAKALRGQHIQATAGT